MAWTISLARITPAVAPFAAKHPIG